MKKVLFATAGFVFVCLVLVMGSVACDPGPSVREREARAKESENPSYVAAMREVEFSDVVEQDGVSIQIEVFSGASSDHAHFHVSEQLTGQSIMGFRGPAETSFMDEQQPPLVKDLFAIKGVAEIHLYPYKISIEKGQRFDWDKLGPQIAEAIFKNIKKS